MTSLPAATTTSEAIADSDLPGPYPVGIYAAQLKRRLLEFARVQLVGEVWGFRSSRARVYFELRDDRGALPCSMWSSDFEALGVVLSDGMRVVIGGGCDYYPGSASSSPSFSFAVSELRIAGEGDLLVQLERLRRRLHADGLFEPQKRLPRPRLPRTIGVVTGERGKARDDVLAGLRRRGWAGRLVWAFAPVQDRHAAPRIAAALRELAAIPEVDVVIVARGGGLAGRPVRVLRRGAVPDRCAAASPGDLLGRPPHRPDADRRRRRGLLLDADPRRRGRRPDRLPAARADLLAAARRLEATAAARSSTGPARSSASPRAPAQHVAP